MLIARQLLGKYVPTATNKQVTIEVLLKFDAAVLLKLCAYLPKHISSTNRLADVLSVLYSAESESYVTTDGQSASQSWYKAPIWAYDQIFISVRNTEYV
jgi:predicted RNA polymerase sigma factor